MKAKKKEDIKKHKKTQRRFKYKMPFFRHLDGGQFICTIIELIDSVRVWQHKKKKKK